jgi:hypothetical protein
MCPYYDPVNERCNISGVNHFNSADCRDSSYWQRCPNYTNR